MAFRDLFTHRDEEIRGLSVQQPWASLIAVGAKLIETRSWSTDYRGLVAVHASKGFPKVCRKLCWSEPYVTALINGEQDQHELPLAAIVAIARLDVVLATADIVAGWERIAGRRADAAAWAAREQSFGDFAPGRFGWFLQDVIRLETPIAARGALGLWKFTDQPDAEAALRARLREAA